MGNLKISTINDVSMTTGYLRNYGMITGGDFIAQCCEKAGRYRMFNTVSTYPPDAKTVSEGGSDYFVDTFLAENNTWVRIEARNVRNENVWERQCRGGKWFDWVLIPNNTQLQPEMDLKVDKVDGKQLSDENFTLPEKQKLANMTSHFKGLFNLSTELPTANCVNGDYAFVKGNPNASIWYWKDGSWKDSGSYLGGSMMKEVYDPFNKCEEVYNRKSHYGTQKMSTIVGLEEALNAKIDKEAIVDRLDSLDPEAPLSAWQGNVLMTAINKIIDGKTPVDYGHYFGETGGYVKLGVGLIVQFGQVSTTSTTATQEFVFPIPFTTKAYGIWATCVGASSSGSGVDGVYGKIVDLTKGSITHDYKNASVTELVHYVFAIGY